MNAHDETTGTGPTSPEQLHAWLAERLGLRIPTRSIIEGHDAPFDYLCHAFFDGRWEPGPIGDDQDRPPPADTDAVVWANRGGGKTYLAAVATLLDLLFKPTIEIRVLAGSLDQARRMHAHLRSLVEGSDFAREVEGRITEKRLRLRNGSNVELLAQSQTSVRGTRVQKLRCDEVELFDPDVWEAAQLTTMSRQCGPVWVPGTIECLSTMHEPHGLMYRLVRECSVETGKDAPRRLFKWGVVDVLGACGPAHECSTCSLLGDCGGRAKQRDGQGGTPGHLPVSDAVRLKSRVGEGTWRAEMLCLRPRRDTCVLPEFDPDRHVFTRAERAWWGRGEDERGTQNPGARNRAWIGGMDFGIRSPTVVLWAVVDSGVVRVVGERVVSGEVLSSHAEAILSGGSGALAPFPVPEWIGVDPAGRQRSEQTGISAIDALKQAGLGVRDRTLGVEAGLESIRARLRPATGEPTLFIHGSCRRLIESLERYRYPADRPESTTPVKDGSDHAVDALRYMIQNLDMPYRTKRARYT